MFIKTFLTDLVLNYTHTKLAIAICTLLFFLYLSEIVAIMYCVCVDYIKPIMLKLKVVFVFVLIFVAISVTAHYTSKINFEGFRLQRESPQKQYENHISPYVRRHSA